MARARARERERERGGEESDSADLILLRLSGFTWSRIAFSWNESTQR